MNSGRCRYCKGGVVGDVLAHEEVCDLRDPEKRRHLALLDASTRASTWLADGNEAQESGKAKKADECYRRAQFWHDRTTKLRGD